MLLEELDQGRNRDRGGIDAGASTGRLLGVHGVRRTIGPKEEPAVTTEDRLQKRIPVFFALGNRLAEVMRT